MTFPSLYQTFRSGGHINPILSVEYKDAIIAFFALIINAIEEDKEIVEDICSFCTLVYQIWSWTIGTLLKSLLFTSPQSNAKLFYPSPQVLEDLFVYGHTISKIK